MAGTGKRADQKKISILKEFGSEYFGKRGFHIHDSITRDIKYINLEDLPEGHDVNLTKLGFDKLLGKGVISRKVKVTVEMCSEIARKKSRKLEGKSFCLEQSNEFPQIADIVHS